MEIDGDLERGCNETQEQQPEASLLSAQYQARIHGSCKTTLGEAAVDDMRWDDML